MKEGRRCNGASPPRTLGRSWHAFTQHNHSGGVLVRGMGILRRSPRWASPRSGACHQGRGPARRRLRTINPLVVLGDNLLVEDAYLFHHQQPHVLDDVTFQLLLGDFLAFYVEPEVLPLQSTAIGEVHLEIELHSSVRGVFVHRPPLSSETSYDIHSTS